ncbi:MAG: type II secretion system protein [Candidatus Paceibacterota bacterium]|jgi:type II secretory pathway pseudopilin PulG
MKNLRAKNGFTHQNFSRKKNLGGFTLIEMTVSLGLFTIVMFIATSSLLSVVQSDRKSRAVRIAADNLNIALEDMSRNIKTGTSYWCGDGGGALNAVNDCPTSGAAGNTLFFTNQAGERVQYSLADGAIWRSVGVEPIIQATSPEITITNFQVYVSGSAIFLAPDTKQPMATVVIDGNINAGGVATGFKVQTTITQRVNDN